jgi:hypothetical protein
MAAIVEKARIGPASIYSKTPVRRYAECLFNSCPMHPFADLQILDDAVDKLLLQVETSLYRRGLLSRSTQNRSTSLVHCGRLLARPPGAL